MARAVFLKFCLIISFLVSVQLLYRVYNIPHALPIISRKILTRGNSNEFSEKSNNEYDFQNVLEDETDDELFGKREDSKTICWSSPERKVVSLSCMDLMEGDEQEIAKAENLFGKGGTKPIVSNVGEMKSLLSDCQRFKIVMGYNNLNNCIVTNEEVNFPIAYSIVVHNDVLQVEKLLRAIYRPHNHYCIHVDWKSDGKVFETLQTMSKCFDNVFLTDVREKVVYAHYSRLKADFNCMSDLLSRNSFWKYLINLTGQMFPLKTNREIVKILSTLRGTNDIEGFSQHTSNNFDVRYKTSYKLIDGKFKETSIKKDPPPFNITVLKGSAFGSFSREFVEYVMTNKRVQLFKEWLEDAYSPDEMFWPTVNSRYVNPMFNAPGAYDGAPERLPWVSTFAAWVPRDKCRGRSVRTICIFGVGDLQQLVTRPEMFANKFYSNYHPLVLECLEEWIYNKTFNPQPFPVFSYLERHYYLHPQLE